MDEDGNVPTQYTTSTATNQTVNVCLDTLPTTRDFAIIMKPSLPFPVHNTVMVPALQQISLHSCKKSGSSLGTRLCNLEQPRTNCAINSVQNTIANIIHSAKPDSSSKFENNPAPRDKKSHSEHQTFILPCAKGSENESVMTS